MPGPQFRVDGVSYVYAGSGSALSDSGLGDVVATVTASLPKSAYRCETFTLEDGQGTPPIGSKIHLIKEVDPSSALAGLVADSYSRFEAK
jgi:hypothetical protein